MRRGRSCSSCLAGSFEREPHRRGRREEVAVATSSRSSEDQSRRAFHRGGRRRTQEDDDGPPRPLRLILLPAHHSHFRASPCFWILLYRLCRGIFRSLTTFDLFQWHSLSALRRTTRSHSSMISLKVFFRGTRKTICVSDRSRSSPR